MENKDEANGPPEMSDDEIAFHEEGEREQAAGMTDNELESAYDRAQLTDGQKFIEMQCAQIMKRLEAGETITPTCFTELMDLAAKLFPDSELTTDLDGQLIWNSGQKWDVGGMDVVSID